MDYTRAQPSPKYRALTELYRRMHLEGDASRGAAPAAMFPGISLRAHVAHIRAMAAATQSQSILDYGCGKGMLYREQPFTIEGSSESWESVSDYWDVDYVACYDPSYPPFSKLPVGQFDGVICTDVLEHCPEEDLPWIVGELFGYARRFVFASIAGHPAKKQLPDGSNAHCTVRPAAWWSALFERNAAQRSGIAWQARFYEQEPATGTITIHELGSAGASRV